MITTPFKSWNDAASDRMRNMPVEESFNDLELIEKSYTTGAQTFELKKVTDTGTPEAMQQRPQSPTLTPSHSNMSMSWRP
ncbi:MAG: hypothetical protein JWQ49_3645 [Edaphobacter sp.]|nr:hypothetical protein [Edaphobacter sp.]